MSDNSPLPAGTAAPSSSPQKVPSEGAIKKINNTGSLKRELPHTSSPNITASQQRLLLMQQQLFQESLQKSHLQNQEKGNIRPPENSRLYERRPSNSAIILGDNSGFQQKVEPTKTGKDQASEGKTSKEESFSLASQIRKSIRRGSEDKQAINSSKQAIKPDPMRRSVDERIEMVREYYLIKLY